MSYRRNAKRLQGASVLEAPRTPWWHLQRWWRWWQAYRRAALRNEIYGWRRTTDLRDIRRELVVGRVALAYRGFTIDDSRLNL